MTWQVPIEKTHQIPDECLCDPKIVCAVVGLVPAIMCRTLFVLSAPGLSWECHRVHQRHRIRAVPKLSQAEWALYGPVLGGSLVLVPVLLLF